MIAERLRRSSGSWLFAAAASVLILAIQIWGPGLQHAWTYSREEIGMGQWYLLLTCHWVHLDWRHAGMNLAGLWLLCLIDTRTTRFWSNGLRCLWLCVAVGVALYILQPGLGWYVGFSGVLHGLFVIALFGLAWHERDRFAVLVLVVLMGKLVVEHYHGALSQGMLNAPVIVEAHSYGALAGLLYSVIGASLMHGRITRETPRD